MWPFFSYPEYPPFRVDGKTYDYVVVGGGTAGCVVASRLSEDPNVSVLLIEKGHVNDNIVSRVPLVSQNMFLGDTLQVQSNRWSEPIPGANGRRNRLWAVEGIGGATRMNAMLWTRGFPGDYAAWTEMGLDEWGYDKIEPYFKKIENAIAHPKSKARGHEGPIELRQFSFPFTWTTYLKKAVRKLGLHIRNDVNDPSAPAMGFFNLDTAIDNHGRRISAMSAYMNKLVASRRRDHLTICTGSVASRLETDGQTGLVTGVHIRPTEGLPTEAFVKVRREVIVCSGAACTPQLLLLSGIGPSSSLERLSIPIVKDLPAVGATLSDHYSFPVMLEVPRKETFHILETLWGIWHILLWLLFGKGLMSLSSVSTALYIRTDAIDKDTMQVKSRDEDGHDNLDASLPCNVPDIEIMFMPNSSLERAIEGSTLISFYPTLVQPHGSGRVELASTDALDQPRITYPMFTNEHDIASARIAVRFTMRLAEELQHSGYPYPTKLAFAPGQDPMMLKEWERSAPAEYKPMAAPYTPSVSSSQEYHKDINSAEDVTEEHVLHEKRTWRDVTDDEIDQYLKRVSHTSLHFSSTCPMSNDERLGVVDQELLVHGFRNLRIADTSVFPKIPSCHTMALAMAVAERCADMVGDAQREKKGQ
ncbi:putative GMC oxidoreductase [Hypoxylon sp. CI-4A]|nr:putative GMC oxidoreductase [Hypoxylon sp. CI-4A]